MSSMTRTTVPFLVMLAACGSVPALARDGSEWDDARLRLAGQQDATIAQAITRWDTLSQSGGRFGFATYADFMLANPGFPEEAKLRGWAEAALDRESPSAERLAAYFERFPPLTNPARAHYALALATLRRPEAQAVALAAWRGGAMSDAAAAAILAANAAAITQSDHDERMDALLWAGSAAQAERQVLYVSPARRTDFMARLGMLNDRDPVALGLGPTPDSLTDPGYVFNRVRQLRRAGNTAAAGALLASRPVASRPPRDAVRWVSELLSVARSSDSSTAVRIAASIDDAFAPGTDISRLGFKLRDDYTSLMWLAGTRALNNLGDARAAAPLFQRYGAAARTPYTRSKGFYWAGRALMKVGDNAGAARYFDYAAQYPDNFYGLLALERVGKPVPRFADFPSGVPSPAERAAFEARPLTAAVRELARGHPWRLTIRFFKEIAEQAETEGEHLLIAQLARDIGRRDLAVILGQSAHSDGFGNFHKISFPQIPTPPGTNWTMIHAITRQESQFAQNAVSHAGARGLMQLMPGTAREQAGKVGLAYAPEALMGDPAYNIRLGDGYIARMIAYYNGSYPLAVAAYNAGPGNVNKWLRANGDPRTGAVEWVDWIERIPLSETRNYVQRVLENAVVYEAMNPERASYTGPDPLSRLLGKRTPG